MKTTTLAIATAMAAVTLAHAKEAVQWRVEDGGNGHWYRIDIGEPMTFADRQEGAAEMGGHLATLNSLPEHQFVLATASAQGGFKGGLWPVLGGFRTAESSDWAWVTEEPVEYLPWAPGEPNSGLATAAYVQMWGGQGMPNLTIDDNASPMVGPVVMLEWSADCNGDGIVDYGQILDGTFADTNANGVPDTCECFADVNQDGVVNGADISAVLGFWGLAGKPLPAADITRDGIVDGADLAVLLGSWGPCQ